MATLFPLPPFLLTTSASEAAAEAASGPTYLIDHDKENKE